MTTAPPLRLDTFTHCRPLSLEQATALLKENYALCGQLSPLDGERDQNFRVDLPDADPERPARPRFVLKLHHPDERPEVLRFQDAVLHDLSRQLPGLRLPRPCPDRWGRTIGGDGDGHAVRLLTWVEGRPLGDLCPLSPDQLRQFGRTLASLDRALAACPIPFDAAPPTGELLWDLQRLTALRPLLPHLPPDLLPTVADLLDRWDRHVAPLLPTLPRQIIHNDAHTANTLADGEGPEAGAVGLIDFGDMTVAPRVQELAVAAAYHPALPDEPPFAPAAYLRDGYEQIAPLLPEERRLLPALIAGRRAMGLIIGCWRSTLEPEDDDLAWATNASARLARLLAALPDDLIASIAE